MDAGITRLMIHGARGSYPVSGPTFLRYTGHTSCFSLSLPRGLLIVDAGTGIASLGDTLAAQKTLPPITILLTHLHFDHVIGLTAFKPLMRSDARVSIMTHPGQIADWQDALRRMLDGPYWPSKPLDGPAALRFVDLQGDAMDLYGAKVSWCPVQHPQGCLSYRLDMPDGAIVIATDRECGHPDLDARFLAFCRGAGVLIHDAQYTPEEHQSRQGWGHSTWEQAARVAAEAGVGQLWLTSHDPARSDDDIDAIVEQARRIFPATRAATESLRLPDPSAVRPMAAEAPADSLAFTYRFRFQDGTERFFAIQVDRATLTLAPPPRQTLPGWTALSYHQCANCPLQKMDDARCPAAVSLIDVMDLFSGAVSFEEVDVTIHTEARTYAKHTSLQQAVSSLIGLLMVTSGCPVMGKLKPMVRFHLPFATDEETKYRVLSMYLLAQFFIEKRGGQPDWKLQRLTQLYEEIRLVNHHFAKRLSDASQGDAPINALVILDSFADSITFSVDERMLNDLEQLFASYIEPT